MAGMDWPHSQLQRCPYFNSTCLTYPCHVNGSGSPSLSHSAHRITLATGLVGKPIQIMKYEGTCICSELLGEKCPYPFFLWLLQYTKRNFLKSALVTIFHPQVEAILRMKAERGWSLSGSQAPNSTSLSHSHKYKITILLLSDHCWFQGNICTVFMLKKKKKT